MSSRSDAMFGGKSKIVDSPDITEYLKESDARSIQDVVEHLRESDDREGVEQTHWPDTRPINATTTDRPYTNAEVTVKSIAQGLVFVHIPDSSDECYTDVLLNFESRLNQAAKKLLPAIDYINIVDHSVTAPDSTRGASSGDRFEIEMSVDDNKSTFIVNLLHSDTRIPTNKAKVDNNELELSNLLDACISDDIAFSHDTNYKPTSQEDIYRSISECINIKYSDISTTGMCTLSFYHNQIDILIKKIKTLEVEDAHPDTLKNYYMLLKYFVDRYLKSTYTERYKHIE